MYKTEEYIEEYFPIVRASTLSVNDRILEHAVRTTRQAMFKKALIGVINSGISDFRAQIMDPSFDEEENICYKVGMKPAIGKSAMWWSKQAINFIPQKHSRIGQPEERIAFLGLLIKKLTEIGYTLNEAWSEVCDNSTNIGHYIYSKEAKGTFESTGSRPIGIWCDLSNTCKITLEKDNRKYYLFGGNCFSKGDTYPLIEKELVLSPRGRNSISVGWIVSDV
ncbi:MAG: hypothetical protein ACI4VH_04210 [Clostridia bacterium]